MKRIGKDSEDSFLVTVDVVGLYPSIPHKEGISALKSKLDEQSSSKIPNDDLVKLAEFVFKNDFFEFNIEIKQLISATAIGTKFAPLYACIYMNKTETDFLKTQELEPFLWLRYTDNIFLIWTQENQNWKFYGGTFFLPNLQFT